PDNAFEQKQVIAGALLRVYQSEAIRFIQDHAQEFVEIMRHGDSAVYEGIGAVDIQLMEPEEVMDILWEDVAQGLDEIDFSTSESANIWEAFQRKLLDHLIDTSVNIAEPPITEPQI